MPVVAQLVAPNHSKIHDDENRCGVVCTLHIVCDNCGFDSQFKTSNRKNNAYEANIRLTYNMRYVGVGREGTNLVCGLMNMPPPTIRYTDTNNVLLKSLKKVCDESMTKAVQQAVSVNDCDGNDLSVSCDGTWMRRGFSSLYGVSTVVSIDTGKVLDAQVLSKYCTTCSTRKKSLNKNEEEQWEQNHAKSCCKNYHGSSGGMEAAGMKLIFHRSQEKYGVRYVKYLGDGDSSAFKSVFESEPYGSDCPIEKLECVGHVQKRMGSRLLKLTKDMKGKKLEDGKGIGGAGGLTKKEIQSIQMYYGAAIRQNVGNLDSMQHAVWAIYFHKLSTDAKPQHGLCGEWCPYKKARNNAQQYSHKHSLPEPVMNAMKPTFRALAKPDLLKKCVHGKTQNPNESLNQLIWKRCPKTLFVSSTVVQIATLDVILVYNDGNVGRIRTLQELVFEPGAFTINIFQGIDSRRIDSANTALQKIQQEARQRRP
ncbi:hypothetical protein ANN_00677 [Periplaneta americana]|uniref:Mutator-like transposase domain-containing protein n=1 Tax=Periplaneta americana TaxID=6978 RepID=A0ABQ8TRL8_PERAM|nr:hypothetical protein ANN_00677 [Periplaneta americana]